MMAELFKVEDILDFTEDKYKRSARKPIPLYGVWEITNACNLQCKYCGLDSGKPAEDELSTEEAFSLIDNIAKAGTSSLMLLGGEPTVRHDLLQIIGYAANFMYVGINTNGVLVNKDYALLLKQAGLNQVKVSLDGARADTHDSSRRAGSYQQALEAIKACQDAGIPSVVIEATISDQNYNELTQLIILAADLRVPIVLNEFIPFGRGAGRADLILNKEKRKAMQEYLMEIRKEVGFGMVGFEDRYIISEDENMKSMCADPFCHFVGMGCNAGLVSYGIKPNGKVVPCPVLRVEAGDLRKDKLTDIWQNSEILKVLRNRDNLKGKCGRCEYKYICGGCRGRTFILTGDFMAEDPLCWYEPLIA